ncbi:Endothelin-converting enzyme 2 [Phytophthora pseudosyringae]|uniref:Endothelin-converting enzyme 2 n=1 Tax=Phytophthora pseudosyringae TaxID=221518 RepID=A0A8T1VK05_9STRA|nr:Endothelin-converting enzyme 2 [Phytophthora pseudosyringae]
MREEGCRGFVKAAWPKEAAGGATAELKLKRESFSACSEPTDQRRREEELLAAFAVARVLARRKLAHETFMEYKKALRRAGESYAIPEPYYVVAFINGVGCEQLTHLLRESKPEDLDAAAKEAILLQRSDGAGPSLLTEQRKRPRAAVPAAPMARRGHEQPRKRPRRDAGSCFVCHQFGHFARECPERWYDP